MTFEWVPSDIEPHPEALASLESVEARQTTVDAAAKEFAAARERIDAGLTWGVGAVVSDPDGRTLLVREDGRWLAPGGEVEPGESHTEALRREVREETGVNIAVGVPVAVTEVVHEHAGQRTSFYFAHYTATPETTDLAVDPGVDGEDIEAVRWAESVPANTLDRDVVVRYSD